MFKMTTKRELEFQLEALQGEVEYLRRSSENQKNYASQCEQRIGQLYMSRENIYKEYSDLIDAQNKERYKEIEESLKYLR